MLRSSYGDSELGGNRQGRTRSVHGQGRRHGMRRHRVQQGTIGAGTNPRFSPTNQLIRANQRLPINLYTTTDPSSLN